MPDICQREDRFTAISFTTGDGGDRTRWGDCGLCRVPDPIRADAIHHRLPLDLRPTPVILRPGQHLRRSPRQVVFVVDGTFYGWERAALFSKFDAGLHRMITDELHHLRAELLPFLRTITHTHVIHQVCKPHDAEPNTTRIVRGLG